MGLEGTSGRVYFQSISKLLPERWQFQGRSRNPAKGSFNCLLIMHMVYIPKVKKLVLLLDLILYWFSAFR
jgi:CRISPR-associated protein Cas1